MTPAMKEKKVKSEPVLIIGAVIIVLQIVAGALTGHIDATLITSGITAVGAIFQRSQVVPMSKV